MSAQAEPNTGTLLPGGKERNKYLLQFFLRDSLPVITDSNADVVVTIPVAGEFNFRIAILLSYLGLMGISGLLVARRFKEVGIRKANGATISQIIWVLVAYVVACPAAWFIMRRWLQDFAYRTEISWWIFILAGIAALLISILTITLQIYRVARQNPVNALRYE